IITESKTFPYRKSDKAPTIIKEAIPIKTPEPNSFPNICQKLSSFSSFKVKRRTETAKDCVPTFPAESKIIGIKAAKATTCARVSSKALIKFRSEEHTSELQSRFDLVCRLLLEKKNNTK